MIFSWSIGRHNIGAYRVPDLMPAGGSHLTSTGLRCYYLAALRVQLIYCKK